MGVKALSIFHVPHLRSTREANGLTTAELAAMVSVHEQVIIDAEAGQPISILLLLDLAYVLGVSSSFLTGVSDDPSRGLPANWKKRLAEAAGGILTTEQLQAFIVHIENRARARRPAVRQNKEINWVH